MTIVEPGTATALRDAAAKVLAGHCIGVPARDANGEPCKIRSAEAVAFCAIGAINLVSPRASVSTDAIEALRASIVADAGGVVSIADWSDALDGPTVAAAMLRAAEKLEAP